VIVNEPLASTDVYEQDVAAARPYLVRLSKAPAPGETVTIVAQSMNTTTGTQTTPPTTYNRTQVSLMYTVFYANGDAANSRTHHLG
jgi:hypothetical protein